MCDCFHLAFPNWHGSPGTGAGRRLKGPESAAEDDSICEEPQEFLEGERPRPQGSSPVNEYPVNEKYSDKQVEEEIYDPYQKSGSTKKGKWVGFGSFFEKRSSAKMSQTEEIEDIESGLIVKAVKEAGTEGLVVRGGGKEGIFVKEVKPESPASKQLGVKEGDQILSATVYFDDVSYEDALQILEHAQACKMELCLKRKTPSTLSTLERSTDTHLEIISGEEGASPVERGRTKTQRRHEARISWPKFPSFSRGHKTYFKRSHSTSEAEEEKLQMSPTTSDTESPIKTQEGAKDKTKRQKVKVSKGKMSLRSKSAGQNENLGVEAALGLVEFVEKQETLEETSDLWSPEPRESMLTETPQTVLLDEPGRKETARIRNECTFPSVSGTEAEVGQHKSELISLDKTLKTTDITKSLADQKHQSAKHSPDVKKRKKKERSELKVNIQGKEKEEWSPGCFLTSPQPLVAHSSPKASKTPDTEDRAPDLSKVLDSTVSPRVISHAEVKEHQMAIDINTQRINISQSTLVDQKSAGEKLSSQITAKSENVDANKTKADISFGMPDVSTSKKYQKTASGKQWKERSILISDLERYGIRSRSSTADRDLTKAHFEVPTTKVDTSPLKTVMPSSGGLFQNISDMNSSKSPSTASLLSGKTQEKISVHKDTGYSKELDVGIKDSSLNIGDSELSAEKNTDDFKGKLDTRISPKFKLPKTDLKDFNVHEPIVKTETDITHVECKEPKVKVKVPNTDKQILVEKIEKKTHLPKREDIEIPGMEATESKGILPLPALKMTLDIHMQKISVDDIKGVSSKTDLSTVKLPKIDLPDLDMHQQITKTDITAEKVKLNIATDIPKSKTPEMITKLQDVSAIVPQTVPNTASSYDMGDETEGKIKAFEMPKQTDNNYSTAELIKRSAPTFKLPKTEFPDADSHQPILTTKLDSSKVNAEILGPKAEENIRKEREGEQICIEQLKVNRPEIRMKLPNREDFEIPGREANIASADSIGSLAIKHPQTGEVIAPATGTTEMQKLQADISTNTIKDTDFKINVSAMKLPKVEFSGPDSHQQVTKTDVNAGKKADVKNEISNTDVQDKELVAQAKKGKFKIPQMPDDDIFPTLKSEINVQKPGNEVRVDTTIAKSVEAKIAETKVKQRQSKAQDVSVKMENTDLKCTVKEPSFVMSKPELKLPQVSDIEIKVSDVSDNAEPLKPRMTISRKTVDIKEHKAESKRQKEDLDSENKVDLFEKLSEVKTEMPKVDAKPDVKGPKLSGDFSLPSVNVSLTKAEAGIEVPTVSVAGSSADVELPETQFKVSGQMPSFDIQGSSVDVEGPSVDVDMQGKGADLQGQGSKFKMPKFGISLPKVKGPEVDISISKPDIDVSLPKAQATAQLPSVDIGVPSVEGQAEFPEADIKDIDVKLKKPKISFPKFGFSKDGKAPEADVSLFKGEVSVPEGSVEIKGPEVDIKSPEIDGKADAEVGGSPSKLKLPHFKLPKFGASAPKGKAELTDVQLDVKVLEIEAPSGKVGMEVKAPDIDIDRPDVELDKTTAEVTMPEINISLPKITRPEIELKTPKAEMDIAVSKPDTEMKGPSIEGKSEIPDIDAGGKAKFHMPSIKMPSFGFSKPDVKGPKLSGDFSLPSVNVSLTKPDAGIEVPTVSVAGSSADVELPETQLKVSGQTPSFDIQGSSVDVEGPSVDVDMQGKGADLQGQGSKFKMPKFGISLPKVKGPEVDISISKPDIDVSLPKAQATAQLPSVDIEVPSVEGQAEFPEADIKDIDVKLKKPKISFPKFGFSKDGKAPEADVSLFKGEVSVPEGSVEIKGPEVDIKSPEIDGKADAEVGGSPSKFKLPHFKLPKFGASAPKGKAELTDVQLDVKVPEIEAPSGKVGMEVKAPDIDIDRPDVELDKTTAEVTMPEINISLPKITRPEIELKTPKAEMDIAVSKPDTEMKGPSIEGKSEIPDIDAGGKAKFHMPSIKMPSFGFSKPDVKGPKLSGDFSLPSVNVSLTKPDAGIEVPTVSVAGSSADVELPETQLKVSGQTPSFDIQGSSVDVEGPSVDVDMQGKGADLQGQGSKFKMPKFGISLPKVKGPEVDISISKPDIDVSLPKAQATAQLPSVDIEVPSVEGQAEFPEADIKDIDVKLKKPKISFPKFGFSKDGKAPEADVSLFKGEVSVPEGSVEIKGPEVDIKSPEIDGKADAEVGGSPSKFKLPHFKLPKFGASAPKGKAELTDVQLDVKVPEIEAPSGKVGMEVKAPDIDIDRPDVELDKTTAEVTMPEINISLPKITRPEIELKTPKAEMDIAVSKPDTEMKGPSIEGKSEIPDIDAGGKAKFHMPSIKMPSFGFSKPDVKGPKLSGDFSLPSVNVSLTKPDAGIEVPTVSVAGSSADVELPETQLKVSGQTPSFDIQGSSVDVEGPSVDVDMQGKGADLQGQGSKFKMPKFGISLPKVKGPEVDISISKPDIDVSLPKAQATAQLPSVDIEVPSVEGQAEFPEADIKDIDVKLKKPKISFPKFGFSKDGKAPEADVSLFKGEVSVPEGSVEIKGPEVDIKSPEIDGKADAEVGGSPSKFKLPHFKLPKFGASAPKGKAELTDVQLDVKVPEIEAPSGKVGMEVKAPDIDIDRPDVELDKTTAEVTMPEINISLPKITRPEIELKTPKAEMDIAVSKPDTEMKGPSIEGKSEIPDIDAGGKAKFHMPSIKMPSFGFSKPDVKGPKLSGDFSLPSVNVSLTKPDAGIEVPTVSVAGSSADVELPETQLKVSGQTPSFDIQGSSVDVEGPSVDVDMQGKGADLQGQGSKFKMPKFGISLPKVKGPEVDISISKPDIDVSLPKAQATAQLPSVDIEVPSVEGQAEFPEADIKDIDVKLKKPKISFPKFGFSKDGKAPEADVSLFKGEVSVPEGSVEIKGPEVDIKSPEIDGKADAEVGGSPSKFKLPHFKLPKFGASAPKGKAELTDVQLDVKVPEIEAPSGKVGMEVKAPDIDIDRPDVELDKTTAEVTMPEINISLPKITRPEIELKTPKAEMDIAVSKPDTEMKGPSIEGKSEIPDIDAGGKAKFHMPSIKMPSFGFSKPDVKGPKLSGDFSLPSVNVSLTKPDAGIEVPTVSVAGSSADVELPETQLKVSGQTPSFDIQGSSVDVEGPSVDVDMQGKGADLQGQGSKFKMPKFGISLPKVKGPEVDISISKPDIDVSLPKAQATAQLPSVDIEVPSVEGQAEFPEADIKDIDVKLKKPKISFPKFGFSKDGKAPEADVSLFKGEVSVPEGSVEIKGPEVDIKSPEIDGKADAEVGGSPSKFKLPHFKLPKFGASAPKGKAELTDVQLDVKVPEIEAPSGKVGMEVKAPDIDIDRPDVELDKTTAEVTMPEINISLPKITRPEIELKTPKAEMDIAVSKPDTEMKGPSIEGKSEIPDIDAGGKAKFHMPSIKMPSFGFSKPDVKGPKLSGDFSLPSVNVSLTKPDAGIEVPTVSVAGSSADVELPETQLKVSGQTPSFDIQGSSVDVEGPSVDVDMQGKGADLQGQGSKFKMPKFGISLPKVKGPEVDISISKPDIDVSLPKAQATAQLPSVDIEVPSVEGQAEFPEADIKDIDVKLKKPKISFPKFGFSKDGKAPEADVSLFKGEVSVPEGSVEIKGPEVDIKSPEIDGKADAEVGGSPSKFKLPHFKLPKFGASAPKGKAELTDVQLDVKVPEIEAPSGKVGMEVKAPDIDIDRPDVELDKTTAEVTMPEINISLPKITRPEIELKTPKAEMDIAVSKPDTEMKGPSIEGKSEIPDIDAGGKAKFHMPSIKMPSFGFSKPDVKGPKLSGDFSLPSVNVSLTKPDAGIEVPTVSVAGSSADVELPETQLKVSGQTPSFDIQGSSVDVEGPSVDVDMQGKGADLQGQGSKFKMPKFGISLPKVKGPEVDISISKPDIDVSLPKAQATAQLPSVDIEVPSVEGQAEFPEADIKDIDVKLKKPKISFPKFGFSKDGKAPEADVSLFKGEVSVPEGSVEIKGPEVDIKSPEIDGKADAEVGGSPSKFKLPHFKLPKFGASAPKGKAELTDVQLDVKVPEIEAPSGKVGMEVKAPDIDIDRPDVELDKTTAEVTMPEINISLPKITRPEIELKTPKAEMDIAVSKPDTEMKGPSIEGKSEIPDIDAGGKAKFHMPSIKMPSFGFSKPDVKGPKLSGDFSLPSVNVSLTKPDAGIEVPTVSVAGSSADVELPETQLKVSGQTPSFDIQGSSVDVEGPSVDVDMQGKGADLQGQGSKFKMPKFGISLPKVKGPEVDISISKPDIDVSLPKAQATAQLPSVDIEVPSVEGQAEFPEADIKDIDVKLKKPKISFPKFGFSKDGKAPEADVSLFKGEVSVPEGSVEIKGPEVDIKSPEIDGKADAEVGGSPSKFKLPHFKLPKFGASAPKGKAELTDVQLDVKVPEIEAPSGKVGMEVKAPDIDIDRPDVELDKTTAEVTMPEINISLPKITRPEIELKTPKAEMDIAVSKPDTEMKGPSIEGKSEIPDIDAGGKAKFHMPSIKMPSFGFSKPDVKGPKLSGDFSLPSVNVSLTKPDAGIEVPTVSVAGSSADVELPETQLKVSGQTPSFDIQGSSVDVEGPSVDVDMQGKGADLQGQGSKFKMPKFGISLPKVKGPEVDISISKPDIDVSLPKAQATAQLPSVDIEVPSVEGQAEFPEADIKDIDVKLKKPKISFPKFGFSKDGKAPEADVSLFKGEVSVPEGSVEIKRPEVDIKSPEIDGKADAEVGGSPSKFKLPHFKLPKFGASAPKGKAELTDVQLDVKVPEIEAPSGKVGMEVKAPDIDIDRPDVELDKTTAEVTMPEINISLPKITRPEIELKTPKAEMDIAVSKPDTEMKGPSTEGKLKDIEVKADADTGGSPRKFKLPSFTFPKFGITGPKITVESKDLNSDIKVSETHISSREEGMIAEVSEVENGGINLEFDKETAKSEVEFKGPSAEGKTEITGKEINAKGKKPRILFPKLGFSKQDIKSSELNVSLPTEDSSFAEGNIEVKVSETDMVTTETEPKADADVGGSPSKYKLPVIKMPKFGFSTTKEKSTDQDTGIMQTDTKSPGIPLEGTTLKLDKQINNTPDSKEKTSGLSLSFPEVRSQDIISTRLEKDKHSVDQPSTVLADGEHHASGIVLEAPKVDKGRIHMNVEEPEKSSRFNLPSFADVFRGFELEFHVPKLDEDEKTLTSSQEEIVPSAIEEEDIHAKSVGKDLSHQPKFSTPTEGTADAPSFTKEAEVKEMSKFKFWFPKISFAESTEKSKSMTLNVVTEKKDMPTHPQEKKEIQDNKEPEAKTEKGSWFKFSKFGTTSPSKTAKELEKVISLPKENLDKNEEGEVAEEDLSLTSSVRSSDAFADISSTITSEQVGPSEASPTKVMVKYSEPAVIVGVGEVKVPSDVITSTARTELIHLEPNLPEKFDTDTIPIAEQATIITKLETHTVQDESLQKAVKMATVPWTVEAPAESLSKTSGEHIMVEKRIVKEKSGDEKGTVIITQKVTHVVRGDLGEPAVGDAASAIKKLKDTMHSEKLRFFEGDETLRVTVSTHGVETQMFESSTENK